MKQIARRLSLGLALVALLAGPALAVNATSVTITNGIPTAPLGAATVSTLDGLMAAGLKMVDAGGNACYGPAGTPGPCLIGIQGVLNGTPVGVSRDSTANSATHGLYSNLLQADAILSATNGLFSNILQANAVLSATNGIFSNLLQANAVLSATNGLFANLLQGNAVLSATNPIFASVTDGTNKAAVKAASTAPLVADPALVVVESPNSALLAAVQSGTGVTSAAVPGSGIYMGVNVGGNLVGMAPGTAGAASTQVFTVQGAASMTPVAVNTTQINSTTALAGAGAVGTGSLRVAVGVDATTIAGSPPAVVAAAPPANAVYLGANASGATGGLVRGLVNCDNHVFKHITSATDTLAVQGVTGQTIYVCGWRSRAAGVATWYLENTASVNANCSSSLTQITGVATEAANTGEVNNNPIWGGLKNTVSNGLCINSTGTGGVDVDIWFAQL